MSKRQDGMPMSITAKSEAARRDFFKKVEKLTRGLSTSRLKDVQDQAASEYNKTFGRIGVHPLLHLKGGKQRPRYVLDRAETWVMYKPPLWEMGGNPMSWTKTLNMLGQKCKRVEEAQRVMHTSEKLESTQSWHGLAQGHGYLVHKPKAENSWSKKQEEEVFDASGKKIRDPSRWGFTNTLEGETDGLLVVAKTYRAQRALDAQHRDLVLGKAYLCLVHGRVENKTHYVKCKFAEIGSDAGSQVLLKHDLENDPFYELTISGKMAKGERKLKVAESVYKPLAYYHKAQDKSDYTLVYMNILTHVPHQVRITMQSEGHPLVSDDRYLPKDQAMSDLKWCPRNFLTEVRSDWFDVCGPYKDPKRRRYERISMENPLPLIFQKVLEERLTLVDKLDPTADLYVGPEYWSLGDVELMTTFPKDDEYRRKVTRWGQRKGIHLDALERMLLLQKEDIDEILSNYRGPKDRDEALWVCPNDMNLNAPWTRVNDDGSCPGMGKMNPCGTHKMQDTHDYETVYGYMDFISDPTVHFLFIVNQKWSEARRKVLGMARPSWERPPVEAIGTQWNKDIQETLQAALQLNLEKGGSGISEADMNKVPGLDHITLPLGAPPEDCPINRTRLPGSGIGSRWMYTLKGKLRIKVTASYEVECKRVSKPLKLKTDRLPDRMVNLPEEVERRKHEEDEDERRKKEWVAEAEKKRKRETEVENQEAEQKKREERKRKAELRKREEEEATRPRKWQKVESSTNPGNFYYFDEMSGETSEHQPHDYQETHGGMWKRMESKTKPGQFYYVNSWSGANDMYPPTINKPWKLFESKSQPGQFYYFHEITQETTVDPPPAAQSATWWPPGSSLSNAHFEQVTQAKENSGNGEIDAAWIKKQSKSTGETYYFNSLTGETTWDDPKTQW